MLSLMDNSKIYEIKHYSSEYCIRNLYNFEESNEDINLISISSKNKYNLSSYDTPQIELCDISRKRSYDNIMIFKINCFDRNMLHMRDIFEYKLSIDYINTLYKRFIFNTYGFVFIKGEWEDFIRGL